MARAGYHRTRGGADEDEDEAAREDLLMLVEGWANAHLHEWSG